MSNLVSILIPAYNAEEWIAETIESALGQTWRNHEIIIIDDGSTDRTVEIARRYEATKVKIERQPHKGAAAARNRAYTLSQGDYIQWLDADDLLTPQKVERQVERARDCASERTLFSCGWAQFMYRPSRARSLRSALWQDLAPLEWLLLKMEQNIYMQTATWLVPRRLADAAGSWNTKLLSDDDGEYFTRVLLQAQHVAFVEGACVFHRAPLGQSLSYVGTSQAKLDAQLASIELTISHLRSRDDSPRVRGACVQYLQTALTYFHVQRPDLVERVRHLALTLGGQVEVPAFSWKYRWIKSLLGQRTAHRAQFALPRARWAVLRQWDRLAGLVEGQVPRSGHR